jgi:hypothetical protein
MDILFSYSDVPRLRLLIIPQLITVPLLFLQQQEHTYVAQPRHSSTFVQIKYKVFCFLLAYGEKTN